MGFQQQLTWYSIYTNFVYCVSGECVQQYSIVNTKLVLNYALLTAGMLQNVSHVMKQKDWPLKASVCSPFGFRYILLSYGLSV